MTRRTQLAILVGVLMPGIAQANAGTPLMWAGMLHLVFGNAMLGLLEAIVLVWVFRTPKSLTLGLMVAANYLSAWLGGLWWVGSLASHLDWHLYNAWRQFWILVSVTYVVTLLIEWPFIALSLPREKRGVARSLRATLLVQTISYLLLFGWYWGATGKSLYTRMQIVPANEITLPANLDLYYIAANTGYIRLADREQSEIVSTNQNDRLLLCALPDHTNRWSLLLRRDARRDEDVRLVTVLPEIVGAMAAAEPPATDQVKSRDTWFNFGEGIKLKPTGQLEWSVETGFWPIEGMTVENNQGKGRYHFAWETLFSQWTMRNVIQLPDEKVIFQLGEDQICVLDPETRRIALLARGRGPTLVLRPD